MDSCPSYKNIKIVLTAEPPSTTKRTTDTYQKRHATAKDKEEVTTEQQKGHKHDKINPMPAGRVTMNWKVIILRSSPTGVKVLSPKLGSPAYGNGNRGGSPKEPGFEGQQEFDWRNYKELEETGTQLLEDIPRGLLYTRMQRKKAMTS